MEDHLYSNNNQFNLIFGLFTYSHIFPRVEHNGELDGAVVGDDYGWLKEHSVVELSEEEQLKFWIALLKYCKKNNIALYTYDDYDAALNELRACLVDII